MQLEMNQCMLCLKQQPASVKMVEGFVCPDCAKERGYWPKDDEKFCPFCKTWQKMDQFFEKRRGCKACLAHRKYLSDKAWEAGAKYR